MGKQASVWFEILASTSLHLTQQLTTTLRATRKCDITPHAANPRSRPGPRNNSWNIEFELFEAVMKTYMIVIAPHFSSGLPSWPLAAATPALVPPHSCLVHCKQTNKFPVCASMLEPVSVEELLISSIFSSIGPS